MVDCAVRSRVVCVACSCMPTSSVRRTTCCGSLDCDRSQGNCVQKQPIALKRSKAQRLASQHGSPETPKDRNRCYLSPHSAVLHQPARWSSAVDVRIFEEPKIDCHVHVLDPLRF